MTETKKPTVQNNHKNSRQNLLNKNAAISFNKICKTQATERQNTSATKSTEITMKRLNLLAPELFFF